jgi:hypothetical protein
VKQIEVSVDVFAALWSARLPHELNEDEILSRILKLERSRGAKVLAPDAGSNYRTEDGVDSSGLKPKSKKWVDVLTWTLMQHNGSATLGEIYKTSRQGRLALGIGITPEHDASARECLESHCKESSKYRGKADLFSMPEGKGAGLWALR